MTIVYASPALDLKVIHQYSKKGPEESRIRKGHVNIWVFDDGELHVDPINNRIAEDGEVVSDTFSLTIEQAQDFVDALQTGINTYLEEFGGEDYEAYEEARSGKLTATNGWDPEYPETSLVYDADGKCLGRLMSVDPEAIAANPSIQPWSKPTR